MNRTWNLSVTWNIFLLIGGKIYFICSASYVWVFQLFHLLYFQQRLKSISWVLYVKYRVQFTSFSFLSTISRISSTFKDLCLIPVYDSGNYTILSALCNLQIFSKRCVKLAENVKLHFDQLIQSLCENLQSEKWRVVRGMGHGSGFHKILWLGEFMERGAWS